jgi:protein-S-isoprenylcysteine O-methyltransferase Ste14
VWQILGQRLFDDVREAPASQLWWIIGLALLLTMVVSLTFYLETERPAVRRASCRYAALLAIFSGLGLSNLIFAALTIPLLSRRIWLVVALTGLLASAVQALRIWQRDTDRDSTTQSPQPANGSDRLQR